MLGFLPFILGLGGLVAFLVVHQREARRGTRFFEMRRAVLDSVASAAYRMVVAGEVPHEYRVALITHARAALHRAIVLVVAILRAIERPLSRMSHRMRSAPPPASREPSEFLKQIGPETEGEKTSSDV